MLAYFTLALQVLRIPQDLLSSRETLKLDGFSSKMKGQKITQFPVILIGQIGKNDLYRRDITGYEMMQYCLSTLLDGQERLGGRIILLECKNNPFLIDFYSRYGFKVIDRDYQADELIQMIKILQDQELIKPDRSEGR